MILPPARPRTSDVSGRIFVFFVDDQHLQFHNTGRVRELFQKISRELLHDGDMFGIVSSGPSSLSIQMTYDKNRLQDAIKKMTGNELKPQEIINSSSGPGGPSEIRYRARVAFSTVEETLKNLEQVHNRRKALIYVSDGYDFTPFANARLGLMDPSSPFAQNQLAQSQNAAAAEAAKSNGTDAVDPTRDTQGLRQNEEFADADLARELWDLTRTANRANVTIRTSSTSRGTGRTGFVGGYQGETEETRARIGSIPRPCGPSTCERRTTSSGCSGSPRITRSACPRATRTARSTCRGCARCSTPSGTRRRGRRRSTSRGRRARAAPARMVDACLRAAGRGPVGLYVSPHLERIEERVCVDGVPAAGDELAAAADALMPYLRATRGTPRFPTFFEILTAAAHVAFRARGVRSLVLEVGLGGRLDATNVCRPAVTAVTTVELEHVKILGDTVEKIAAEKAGIVKAGRPRA